MANCRYRDNFFTNPSMKTEGRGCDAVGRAVGSDDRDPRFESSHRQIILTINSKENKEKDVSALSSIDNSSKNNIIDAISSANKVNNQQTLSSFTPKQSLIRSRLRN